MQLERGIHAAAAWNSKGLTDFRAIRANEPNGSGRSRRGANASPGHGGRFCGMNAALLSLPLHRSG